jgi:UDP-glucose:tetrahydrobiopterin glucosyltransferase
MSHPPLKLLFLSTAVGPLGSGLGGGVELTLRNIAKALSQRGYTVDIVAPKGSALAGISVIEIDGDLHTNPPLHERNYPVIMPPHSVLGNMWEYAWNHQGDYDIIVNFAYDWLPFYLTPLFQKPIAHLLSMASVFETMDRVIEKVAIAFPGTIGVHSFAQGETYNFSERCRCLSHSLDLSLYEFNNAPIQKLAWVGRISPEKGLEDAVAAAYKSGMRLKVYGMIQNESYWQKVQSDFPWYVMEYQGAWQTETLQKELGQCQALLVTPHSDDSLGNVAIEAMACGVPIVAYRRGDMTEIVRDYQTGYLVEPEDVFGLVNAIRRLDQINRHACRQQAEQEFSLDALGDRFEQWFQDILRAKN